MAGVYEPKIANCCVANLGNSLAIICDLRLALGNFESHIRSSRINQRFLNSVSVCFTRHRLFFIPTTVTAGSSVTGIGVDLPPINS